MASRNLSFHIVDVFAETAYAGNQLAVFHGDMPDVAEMQQIAREINFAETTFLLDSEMPGECHRVRIFTPEAEVPFAGHPTLGSVHVLRTAFGQGVSLGDGQWRMHLSLQAGDIPVVWSEAPGAQEAGLYRMTQRQPVFGQAVDKGMAADWLGIRIDDVSDEGPCQLVTTGLPFLIVSLGSLDAVRRAALSKEGAKAAASACGASGVLVFAREGREPGHDLSVLHLRGRYTGNRYDIEVGGRCRTVAEGMWR